MEEKSVTAMNDIGSAIEKLHLARSKRAIKDEQELFVMDGIDDRDDPKDPEDAKRNKKDRSEINHKFFLRCVLRVHVPVEHVWYVYRNEKFYKKLLNGMHWLWNWDIFFTKWQVRRINLRTVLLPAYAAGRVKGPPLPQGHDLGANQDLGLDVIADFRLLCKISVIENFLRHENPIKIFYASFNNIVQQRISELPYDQHGKWASRLRAELEYDLQQGPDNTEQLIGVKIEKVFVDSVASNAEHDDQVLAMYRLVEKGKREVEAALSMEKQGQILEIAPSILALQNNEIGRELIQSDAELRKLMIAAGLRPNGMLPIRTDVLPENPPSYGGYLPSPPPRQRLPQNVINASGSLPYVPQPPQGASGPLYNTQQYQGTSGPLPQFNPPPASPNPMTPLPPQPAPISSSHSLPLVPDATESLKLRQELEIKKLKEAMFICRNWAQKSSQFDAQGQPLAGSIEWTLDVYVQLTSGYLVITFQCTEDYPFKAPAVRVRPPNSTEWKELWPNTLTNWSANSFLVDVVREIKEGIPG